jgi:hypothetical protein
MGPLWNMSPQGLGSEVYTHPSQLTTQQSRLVPLACVENHPQAKSYQGGFIKVNSAD